LNWAAALYAAGIWALAASIWSTAFRISRPNRGSQLSLRVTLDLLPGFVLALIIAFFA
jgi:hypothetical protein